MNNPDTRSQLIAYGIQDIMSAARVGRSTVFNEIRERRLKARKVGRRTVVLAEDFQAWLDELPRVNPAEAA